MPKIDQIKWEDSLKIQLTKLAQGKKKVMSIKYNIFVIKMFMWFHW